MIHAYADYYLDMAQSKLASMFEIALYEEKMDIDEFGEKFVSSLVSKAIEKGDPIYLAGKSANELLGLVINKQMEQTEQNQFASPEYWVGWVLAYTQWYTNKAFAEIIKAYPCSKLLLNYFPYHEMEIMKIVELIQKHLSNEPTLKMWRRKRKLSQTELAKISGVSLRSIKAYEQGKLDITKAQGETLFKLARTLCCTMEDLMK